MDLIFNYKLFKTLHIIFFTTWMAGLFYLPRIYVYHSKEKIIPKNVHFTTGGPWFSNWTPKRDIDQTYSDEWKRIKEQSISEHSNIRLSSILY